MTFVVPFEPVAKGRARSVYMPGRGVRHYTPKKTAVWEQTVAVYARQACRAPMTGPLSMELGFYLPVPASWPAWKREMALAGGVSPTAKPDLDNLGKAFFDACNGIAWIDDAQVVTTTSWKLYAATGSVYVHIKPLYDLLPAQVTRRPTPQKETPAHAR